jgi:hypothetical protein
MRITRVRLNHLAFLGFAPTFLFLLVVVALAVSAGNVVKDLPHSHPTGQPK